MDLLETFTAGTDFTLSIDDLKKCIQIKFSVDKELEDKWMIRYTKIYTRELVFAVDVMSFVLQENHVLFKNFIYPNCLGIPCTSDFDGVMRTFMALTLTKYIPKTQKMLERYVNLAQPNYREFKAYVNSIALSTMMMPRFKAYAFLVFCVVMAQMCSLGFLFGMQKAPDFGIMLICRAYSNFEVKGLLPEDTWTVLKEAASNGVVMRTLDTLKSVTAC